MQLCTWTCTLYNGTHNCMSWIAYSGICTVHVQYLAFGSGNGCESIANMSLPIPVGHSNLLLHFTMHQGHVEFMQTHHCASKIKQFGKETKIHNQQSCRDPARSCLNSSISHGYIQLQSNIRNKFSTTMVFLGAKWSTCIAALKSNWMLRIYVKLEHAIK